MVQHTSTRRTNRKEDDEVQNLVNGFRRLSRARDMADAVMAILKSWCAVDDASFNVITQECIDRHPDFVEMISMMAFRAEVSHAARTRTPVTTPVSRHPVCWQQDHHDNFVSMVKIERDLMIQRGMAKAYRVRLDAVEEDVREVHAKIMATEKDFMEHVDKLALLESNLEGLVTSCEYMQQQTDHMRVWRDGLEENTRRMSAECAQMMTDLDETSELLQRVEGLLVNC